jgi:hypothetical protein
MSDNYKMKVGLLLRIIPILSKEECFAIHGGTAINLFLLDMPRYSVDIDLTYLPIEERIRSIDNINAALQRISIAIHREIQGCIVVHRTDICKIICNYMNMQLKIEVNQTKRGLACGEVQTLPLRKKAQEEFKLYCEANIVPTTLLYGGKIAAALSRQHPRDLFDIKYMTFPLENAKEGFIFCLLGSDRPLHESFAPNLLDQREVMSNQFAGMTELDFSYEVYESTRSELITRVNSMMNDSDKEFLLSFENAKPKWGIVPYSYFAVYPSVKWKLINLKKLAQTNPVKLNAEVERLRQIFSR